VSETDAETRLKDFFLHGFASTEGECGWCAETLPAHNNVSNVCLVWAWEQVCAIVASQREQIAALTVRDLQLRMELLDALRENSALTAERDRLCGRTSPEPTNWRRNHGWERDDR
jgi:hypothetical protein